MKIKHLLVVSLLLAIMTIGAASASESVTCDDLAVEDAIDDSAIQVDDSIQDEGKVVEADDGDITGDGADLEALISEQENVDSGYMRILRLQYPEGQNLQEGNLTVYVDDSLEYNQTISSNQFHGYYTYMGKGYFFNDIFNWDLINEINTTGLHKVDAFFNGESLASGNIYVINYDFHLYTFDQHNTCDSRIYFSLGSFPRDATGNLTLTINNMTYNLDYQNDYPHIELSSKGWEIGTYTAVATYSGDDHYLPASTQFTFDLEPKIDIPSSISIGEDQSITIIATGASGLVEISISNSSQVILRHNITVSDGYGSYSLSALDEGYYNVAMNVQIGSLNFTRSNSFSVHENNANYSSSILQSEIGLGDNVYINITGPVGSWMEVYLDGDEIKYLRLAYGFSLEQICGLSLGSHVIRVVSDSYGYYAKTYNVTVKEKTAPAPVKDTVKLTLNKAKVKKSAKKLVLSATLKINGKAVNGKVIKFKFNKKTYSAKTNAKGIAKVTIKKAVLKKLKAGKKITYQAAYGKTVKKITVKVVK